MSFHYCSNSVCHIFSVYHIFVSLLLTFVIMKATIFVLLILLL